MDEEAELLGEMDGDPAMVDRQISQEEEDALLNEPVSTTSPKAADHTCAKYAADAAATAATADLPPAADDEEMMNEDSESNSASDERREEPSETVPASSQEDPASSQEVPEAPEVPDSSNEVPASSSDCETKTYTATAADIRNSGYFRSIVRLGNENKSSSVERVLKKIEQREQRMIELSDEQRRNYSNIASLQADQKEISKRIEDLSMAIEKVTPQPSPSSNVRRSVPAAGAAAAAAAATPAAAGSDKLQQLRLQQQRQREAAAIAACAAQARRTSNDGASTSKAAAAAAPQRGRASNDGASTSRAAAAVAQRQQQMKQQQQQAQQRRSGATAAPPASLNGSLPLDGPSPGRPQKGQSTPQAAAAAARAAQQQQQNGNASPAGSHVSQHSARMQQPQNQRAPFRGGAPANGQRPPAAAAVPPSPAASAAISQQAAAAAAQRQQQLSRKRPHAASDGHPGMQQPQQPLRNGQHPGMQQQMLMQQQGMQPPIQHQLTRPPPAMSPDMDPELRNLSVYINSIFTRKLLSPATQHAHSRAYSFLLQAYRLEVMLRDARNAPHPDLNMGPPGDQKEFVVPPENSLRKIAVDVPGWLQMRPETRPSIEIPLPAELKKASTDRHAPRVEFSSNFQDFNDSAKLSGRVLYTPPNDWPEESARVCIFFYAATQNTLAWLQSDFATADYKERDARGNFKEAAVRFIISLDKGHYFSKDARGNCNRNIKNELFAVVPFVCAGSGSKQVSVRGEEASFNYEEMDQAQTRRKYEHLMNQMRAFVEADQAREGNEAAGAMAVQPQQGLAAEDEDDEIQIL